MALSKDLLIATGLLLVCCVVLAVAFTRPDADDSSNSSSIASNDSHRPPTPPSDSEPTPPPAGGSVDEESGGISIGELVDDEPEQPVVPVDNSTGDGGEAVAVNDSGSGDGGGEDGFFPLPEPGEEPGRTESESEPDDRGAEVAGLWPGRDQTGQRQRSPREHAGGSGQVHTVQSGETLSDIALKYYGTSRDSAWQRIRDANGGVDTHALHVGQSLTIPAAAGVVPDREQGTVRGDGKSYVVQKGDSYYTIARDQLGDASRFEEVQKLNEKDAYQLMPGDVIQLPERAARPAPQGPSGNNAPQLTLPSGARWHEVAEGEVLGTISQRYYGTAKRWKEIAAANGIRDPRALRAGTRIIVPNAGDGPAPRRAQPNAGGSTAPRRGQGVEHSVANGDRLEDLAQRYYGDAGKWRKIQSANPGLHPRKLIVGQKIWIPDAQRSSPAAPTRDAEDESRRTWPAPASRDSSRAREENDADEGGSRLFRFD